MHRFGVVASVVASVLIVILSASVATADVVVIVNRTDDLAHFSIDSDLGLVDAQLEPNESQPFPTSGASLIVLGNSRVAVGKQFPTTKLRPNAVYKLLAPNELLTVERVNLGGNEFTLKPDPDLQTLLKAKEEKQTIPASLWVDDDHSEAQSTWEPKLRERFAKAAEIIKRKTGVEFKVTTVGRWRSSNRIRVFSGTLHEFVDSVNPKGTLAIGFSSQYSRVDPSGSQRIAGTRQPLDQHILVREWERTISEAERVELLVHELGHFLGACHSTDKKSVMRSELADGAAREKGFRIGFDPTNILVMYIVGEQLTAKGIQPNGLSSIDQLTPQAKLRLRQIYSQMATTTPSDPVPTKYLMILK